MGGIFKSSPSPPPPPDYVGAAKAQGAANRETAIAQSLLNNPNVIGPFGTQRWMGGEEGDRPTLYQELSPAQQAVLDRQLAVKSDLSDLALLGSSAARGVLGSPLDLSSLPPRPGSFEELRSRAYEAQMARTQEDAQRAKDQAHADLIAAGIRPGTRAYEDRMHAIQRGVNDAANQAYLAASQHAQQAFVTESERRRQALAELLTGRQTPINEIAALMSGSQVVNPFAMPGVVPSQIAPPPIFGAHQAQHQAAMDAYNVEAQRQAGLMSGLFSLGAAALRSPWLSDRRLKSNINRVGTHRLGIGIYVYDIFGRRELGVMADEVLAVMPDAVSVGPFGYLMVDYAKIG